MSLFSGGNFYWTNLEEDSIEQKINRFIDQADGNAVAIIEEDGELTLDMIFSSLKLISGTDIEVTCIYARYDESKIGKTFVVPYGNLISYRNAMQERDFFKLGDIAVGLPSSRVYHVTSIDSFFVGKVMLEDDYDNDGTQICTKRWGDIYCTLSTIHSTEGLPGDVHRVEMHHFIPSNNPGKFFEEVGHLYAYVGISEDTENLIKGAMYPVKGLSMNGTENLEIEIDGIDKRIPFDFTGMRLVKEGELI